MFKKFKDKLAEEVKSSPQRIQQFAQIAQAAVTSTSSSISDITNTELFSIDNNDQPRRLTKPETSPNTQKNPFQDIESEIYSSKQDITENQRQRRLSNSSFSSDISFRLPNYESPSVYHLQSDMEISASETEERSFSSGAVCLERVTKEQIYAAYKRTQERYSKYRTQYADLARHYKLLERENAKARSVLVETQDKALRRLSELREQCSLEQSAKAHLEKALRVDIEERNIKIQTLQTQINFLLHTNPCQHNIESENKKFENEGPLINLRVDNNENKEHESLISDVNVMNNNLEKMEQLVNKYKESLKQAKEKNNQLTTEIQLLSSELNNKLREDDNLLIMGKELTEAREQIHKLKCLNEELQKKINSFEFTKNNHPSTLQIDFQKSGEEIKQLQYQVAVLTKREEENAISLAENKLSIHKELESKENEIKSLKESLAASKKEIHSLNIIIDDYKISASSMEVDKPKLYKEVDEFNVVKGKDNDLELQLKVLQEKCQLIEIAKSKIEEEFKCSQLQLKQETAEKLAMIDRNGYLEHRNSQLSEENTKKSLQINHLEKEILVFQNSDSNNKKSAENEKNKLQQEIDVWKVKYSGLESEIQEEREELFKLQSEIEKLMNNHELIQIENNKLNSLVQDMKAENTVLKREKIKNDNLKVQYADLLKQTNNIKRLNLLISQDYKNLIINTNENQTVLAENIKLLLNYIGQIDDIETVKTAYLASQEKIGELTDNLNKYESNNNELKSVMQHLTSENALISTNLNELQNQYQMITEEINTVKRENEKLNEKLLVAAHETNKNSTDEGKMALIEQERQASMEIIEFMRKENEVIAEELANLKNKNEDNSARLNGLLRENETLIGKINILEGERSISIKNLECNIKLQTEENIQLRTNVEILSQKLSELEIMKRKLIDDEEKHDLIIELDNLKLKYQENIDQLNLLTEANCEIINRTKASGSDKNVSYETLNNEIKFVKENDVTLQKPSDFFSSNLTHFETDLSYLPKSHDEIDNENNHLSSVIDKFECHQAQIVNTTSQHTQTMIDIVPKEYREVDSQTVDLFVDKIQDHNQIRHKNLASVKLYETTSSYVQNELERENTEMLSYEKILNRYNSLEKSFNSQKEENRRLKSDIAGLQTHLTKISKDNSNLNDKLRVMIASDDDSQNRAEDLPQAYDKDLQNREENLCKMDNLIRENTLLIDENLELKEQLYSHNHKDTTEQAKNVYETQYLNQAKYDGVLERNVILEKRLSDLEHLNSAVNNNMLQVQENNQKLRLSNEKLERRLDEALVSLRHLHSLQENTELEYLRNILYEYLTGSGTHSVTLAKVLSAVVKFDETQTQQVLQKEKERQGFNRRSGNDFSELFITACGQVKAASRTTLAGWVKSLLRAAGVVASAGSTRRAAASLNQLDDHSNDEVMMVKGEG